MPLPTAPGASGITAGAASVESTGSAVVVMIGSPGSSSGSGGFRKPVRTGGTLPCIYQWRSCSAGQRDNLPAGCRAMAADHRSGSQPAGLDLELWHRFDQGLRIGVPRRVEDLPDITLFYDPSRVHDGDPVTHLGDNPEVVRDEDDRHAVLCLELLQEPQVGRLNRHVERRGLVRRR